MIDRREILVGPVVGAGLGVEAIDEAAQVGGVEQAVGNGDGGDGAVVVFVAKVPDCACLGDVAGAAGVNGPQVPLAFAVLGVLADADEAERVQVRVGDFRLTVSAASGSFSASFLQYEVVPDKRISIGIDSVEREAHQRTGGTQSRSPQPAQRADG